MKKILKISLMITCTLFLSNAYSKTYKIKKGKHGAAGVQIGIFSGDDIKFNATFNSSAIYDLGNDNQGDTNKLFGFSDCYSAHHKISARFGWRWNLETAKLEILAYVYHAGQREIELIDNVDLNKSYAYKIIVHPRTYEFQLNNKSIELPRSCSAKRAHGYKLYPYFGGDEVAPHEIKIEIDR